MGSGAQGKAGKFWSWSLQELGVTCDREGGGYVWLWKLKLLPGDRVPPSSPSPPPFFFLLVELWRGLEEVWLCEWMPSLLGWLVLPTQVALNSVSV